jgi:DNA-binding transcriptional regulator YiaG
MSKLPPSRRIRVSPKRQYVPPHASGARLREIRIARHLTQTGLAKQLGVSVRTIRRWEKMTIVDWNEAP